MTVQNIIWDFDGTLYNTYGAIVDSFLSSLQENHGIVEQADKILSLVKIDTKHCTKTLAAEYGLDEQVLLTQARACYNGIDVSSQKPFPFVEDLCTQLLKSGGANFLVTHRDKKSLDEMLGKFAADKLFTDIITRDDGFPLKPDPASFNSIINKYSLTRSKTVGIGDRDLDVLAANAAGIESIFFSPDGETHPQAKTNISCFSAMLQSDEY